MSPERESTHENDLDKTIIMATTSEIKVRLLKQALEQLGVEVAVLPTNVGIPEREWETSFLNGPFGRFGHHCLIPQVLACLKANEVVNSSSHLPVIASDSAKIIDGAKILGRPATFEDAVDMILCQVDKQVLQIAGVAFWNGQKWTFGTIKTTLQLNGIPLDQVRDYVYKTPGVLSAAGAIPISDPKALEVFYPALPFPTVMTCYNEDGENVWEKITGISVVRTNLTELTWATYGFSPPLLEAMGLLNLEANQQDPLSSVRGESYSRNDAGNTL